MNDKLENFQDRPVLDAESFQRLLAAAFVLQTYRDSLHSVPLALAGAARVQRRTPSLRIQRLDCDAAQSGALSRHLPGMKIDQPSLSSPPLLEGLSLFDKTSQYISRRSESAGGRVSAPAPVKMVPAKTMPVRTESNRPVFHLVRQLPKLETARLMRWRTVEAIGIAAVFCLLVGVSLHRLSDVPTRLSVSAKTTEQSVDPFADPAKVLTNGKPVVSRNSSQSGNVSEADIVAKDVVIYHQKRAGQGIISPAKSPRGRDADMLAADTSVQYGSDVTMWLRAPSKPALDRLGH